MRRRVFPSICTMLCTALVAHPAAATVTICVTNASNFRAALTAAEDSSEKTVIKLVRGTYSTGATGSFYFDSGTGQQLDLSGGYNNDCSAQTQDPALTVLDGGSATGILSLYNLGGGISVRYLTVQNGNSGQANAAGLYAFSGAGPVIVSYNIFRNNSAGQDSAVYMGISGNSGTGNVTFWGNLVVGNTAIGNAFATASNAGGSIENTGTGTIYISNNTVADNILANPVAGAVGGFTIATANVSLSNNIFWANSPGSLDVSIPTGRPVLVDNDIGTLSADPATGSAGNVAVPPQFYGSADYRLSPTSPLLASGTLTPPGGLPLIDIRGHARTFNDTVDLGAYEHGDEIFKNDFED